MKNLFSRLLAHLAFNKEGYLWIPLALLLTLGAIAGVPLLTGRTVIDDPAAIVGWLYNLCGAILVCALTGQVQTHLFGYRSQEDPDPIPGLRTPVPFRDDLFDAGVTFGLLLFFAWLIFCR